MRSSSCGSTRGYAGITRSVKGIVKKLDNFDVHVEAQCDTGFLFRIIRDYSPYGSLCNVKYRSKDEEIE